MVRLALARAQEIVNERRGELGTAAPRARRGRKPKAPVAEVKANESLASA